MSSKKMTYRQFSMLFVLSVASVGVFYSPISISRAAGTAGWLVPLITFIPFLLFFFMFADMVRRCGSPLYQEGLRTAFGNTAAKVIGVIYALWTLFLSSVKIIIFVNRLIDNVFYYFPALLCVAGLLLCVSVSLFSGNRAFGKTVQMCFILFLILMITVVLLSAKSIDVKNLLPVTVYDLPSAVEVAFYPLSSLAYFTYFSMIERENADFKKIKRYGVFCAVSATVFALIVFIMNTGIFKTQVVKKLIFPFFSVLKSTSRFGSLEHMEAVIIALWTVTDFALAGGLMLSCLTNLRSLFKSGRRLPRLLCVALPIISFFICTSFGRLQFDAEKISRGFATWVNIAIGVILPVAVWAIVCIKRRVGHKNIVKT